MGATAGGMPAERVLIFDSHEALVGAGKMSELAARHVKVVLTGDGGDELFAGYDDGISLDLENSTCDRQIWPDGSLFELGPASTCRLVPFWWASRSPRRWSLAERAASSADRLLFPLFSPVSPAMLGGPQFDTGVSSKPR